jgi:AcrR family transcriptional regulator
MGRPKTPLLSRDAIADAALKLIDRNGKVTVSEVAKALGVSPPSLYNHVSGLQDIVEMVRERIHVQQGPKIDPAWTWQEVIRHVAQHDRDSIGEHPWTVADLMISTVEADEALDSVRTFARVLEDSGFRADEVLLIIGAVDLLTAGGALDLNAPERVYPIDAELADDSFGRALRAAPKGRARADAVFTFAVDALIATLERRLAAD